MKTSPKEEETETDFSMPASFAGEWKMVVSRRSGQWSFSMKNFSKSCEPADLKRGSEALQRLLAAYRIEGEILMQNEDGILVHFHVGRAPFVAHLYISRSPNNPRRPAPVSKILRETAHRLKAAPLPLCLHLRVRDGLLDYRYGGLSEFSQAIHGSRRDWQRHLLGGDEPMDWIHRAGGLAILKVFTSRNSLRIRINDAMPTVPSWSESEQREVPIDPSELCRSTCTSDECWIFTCGCGEPGCNGIYSGISVVHSGAFTIWASIERPEEPLAIFNTMAYRRTILKAANALLGAMRERSERADWRLEYDLRSLSVALRKAGIGKPWFRRIPVVLQEILEP